MVCLLSNLKNSKGIWGVLEKRDIIKVNYLNTVKNGGTKFFYQNKIIQANIGKTVIWPAAWTHTHTGQISKTQTKYIITGWFRYV